jgi:hypothetical protein
MAGSIFSKLVLDVARSSPVASFAADSRLAEPLVRRFVAGETLDQAALVARDLNRQGMLVSLDYLGEDATSVAGAAEASQVALETLDRMSRDRLRAYLSVKLTQLGFGVGEYVLMRGARAVLDRAKSRTPRARSRSSKSSATTMTTSASSYRRICTAAGRMLSGYHESARASGYAKAPTTSRRTLPSDGNVTRTEIMCGSWSTCCFMGPLPP